MKMTTDAVYKKQNLYTKGGQKVNRTSLKKKGKVVRIKRIYLNPGPSGFTRQLSLSPPPQNRRTRYLFQRCASERDSVTAPDDTYTAPSFVKHTLV